MDSALPRSRATKSALAQARKRRGPIARREVWLAFTLLLPTVASVLMIILIPMFANFWISVKPVELSDLRAAKPLVRERLRGTSAGEASERFQVEYQVRSSSPKEAIRDVQLHDRVPSGLTVLEYDEACSVVGPIITCSLGTIDPRSRRIVKLALRAEAPGDASAALPTDTVPTITGTSRNVLTNLEFTLENFSRVFDAREFWTVLWVSIVYTVFGTLGALVLGLFAAQLLMAAFPGRALLRGLFLFPYVSPVIAVAFTWVFLLDPFSGSINALLVRSGLAGVPINFLGQRGIALWTVIAFEAWRYFPLAFLFILARMQSLSTTLNEAAEMDGATPFQAFWYISLPQLVGILSTLFLLRFIWTFNKFDDIFLLTGGASGTRTLTVNVYEQAFALSNLGAGAAVAVVIFLVLATFVSLFYRFGPREAGL